MKRLALLAIMAASTGCASAPSEEAPRYLALGDSVAFGFDPRVDLKTQAVSGYPELIGGQLGLDVTNMACPGEATGGFVSPTGNDHRCRENRQAYPLHVAYEGTQLAAAVDFLADHPSAQLVTIDIGANDLFRLQHMCAEDTGCILEGFVPMMMELERNLDFIFTQLRKNYDGPMVALSIYNPYPGDDLAQYSIEKINLALAEKIEGKGVLADGMAAFDAASGGDPCKAGLLIPMPDGTCDVHPTPAGAKVLADAIDAALTRSGLQ